MTEPSDIFRCRTIEDLITFFGCTSDEADHFRSIAQNKPYSDVDWDMRAALSAAYAAARAEKRVINGCRERAPETMARIRPQFNDATDEECARIISKGGW